MDKKLSYRENDDKPKNICIRDNVNTAASQTDTSACCDTDMTETQCTIRRGNIGINCEQALIKSLENGIASLERLLQQKQEIIDRQPSEKQNIIQKLLINNNIQAQVQLKPLLNNEEQSTQKKQNDAKTTGKYKKEPERKEENNEKAKAKKPTNKRMLKPN